MLNLFEGKTSLHDLESLGEEVEQSDDIARLKGLLLWLAWDCGLTLDLKKSFLEDPDRKKVRLQQNAMVLALAQIIDGDEVVIDEAKHSIGSLTTSEMDWLKNIQRIADQCDSMKQTDFILEPASEAEPGDVAIHKSKKGLPIRIVSSRAPGRINLVSLSRDKDYVAFTPDHLGVARF